MRTLIKDSTDEGPRHQSGVGSTASRRPVSVLVLSILLVLLAIGAFQGGLAMLANPVDPLGMSPSFLEGTPVSSYFWPGMFLVSVALASVVTAAGLLFDWRWVMGSAHRGHRWVPLAMAGCLLHRNDPVDLRDHRAVLIPFRPIMHPLLIAWSAAIVMLPSWPSARAYLTVRRDD